MPVPMPSVEDLRLAALWCDNNEGDEDDEQAPLERVARWLEQQADAKELREAAKEHGTSVAKLKAAMRRAEQGQKPAAGNGGT